MIGIAAKELILDEHQVGIVEVPVIDGEMIVPEQRQFFFQRSGGLRHPL